MLLLQRYAVVSEKSLWRGPKTLAALPSAASKVTIRGRGNEHVDLGLGGFCTPNEERRPQRHWIPESKATVTVA
jgi:hypothetical protein